jgi:hypothetical protein
MHTILLLLFYLPIQPLLNAVKPSDSQTEDGEEGKGDKKVKSWFSYAAGGLGSLLATTSPIIVSLIEKAISDLM